MRSPTYRLVLAVSALLDKALARCRPSIPDKTRLVGPLTIARLLLVGAAMTAVVAQGEPPVVRSNADLTVEQVRRTAREAEVRKDIDVPTKARIAEPSPATLADLERVPELRAQAETYRQSMRDAPDQIRDLERTLEKLRSESDQAVAGPSSSGSTLNELEQARAQADTRLAAARAELAMLDLEIERVDTEPAELRNAQREAQAGLERSREEIQTASGASRQTFLTITETQATRAALLVREAQADALRSRIDTQPLLARLTQLLVFAIDGSGQNLGEARLV
jgi:potassium efflux system protein